MLAKYVENFVNIAPFGTPRVEFAVGVGPGTAFSKSVVAFTIHPMLSRNNGNIFAALMDVHYEPSVLHPQNSTARHIIDKTNREFLAFLEEVLSGGDALTPAEIPYARVIVGEEAASLIDRFRSVWGYVNTSFWFPLLGEAPEEISEKFFIMYEYCEPYMRQLEQIIGLPQEHIYSYGENGFRPECCFETAELIAYSGQETIFTDKGFTWAIYFSHENTVSFAGSIVPKVKNLLMAEKAHWDKFEWNWEEK